MISFADEAIITVTSGAGGNGCVSFRREKYIPNGGPAGGDGGKGGDIVFCVRRNLRTLAALRYKQHFKAQRGQDGMGRQRYGKNGEDMLIPVPPGTSIFDAETGELLKEFTTQSEDEHYVCLEGGKGGWGNMHFKTSTNQAPRYAHDGKPAQSRTLRVELSIMADVGLVGFPNAGKSSLLDAFTNARPKIAPYPFTTKIPNLGVLRANAERDIIIADIPGIIEGAADGAGLGIRFLKHISRTQCLLYMIDVSDTNYLTAYDTLRSELESFSSDLVRKPAIVLCNKTDVDGAEQNARELIAQLRQKHPEVTALPVSIMARTGMNEARLAIMELVDRLENQARAHGTAGSAALPAQKSSFLASRSVDTAMQEQFPGMEPAEA